MADIYHLYGMLSAIDDEMQKLAFRRNEIVRNIDFTEECLAMRARATLMVGIINSVASIDDPVMSLAHRNDRLEPWRHNLPRKYFENVHSAWDTPKSRWSRTEASVFFKALSLALALDIAAFDRIVFTI